jgi:dTDP-4-amino-4,6-dideoxygalactose transaminase
LVVPVWSSYEMEADTIAQNNNLLIVEDAAQAHGAIAN